MSNPSTPDYPHLNTSEPEQNLRLTATFSSARIGSTMERRPGRKGQYNPSHGAADHEVAQPLQARIETVRQGRKSHLERQINSSRVEEVDVPGPMEATDVKHNLNCSASHDGGSPMKSRIPDEDLFQNDTERWLTKYMGDLSPQQIEEQLQIIRMMSLLQFYQAVAESYPELLNDLPKIPRILVSEPFSLSMTLGPSTP
jgi:hypothetical protein